MLAQRGGVKLKRTGARRLQLAHLGLDLSATHHTRVDETVADDGFELGFRRVVAEIGHPDELAAKSQGKHNFRSAGE